MTDDLDEQMLRYLDTDWPSIHEFRAGVLIPDACVLCGDEIAAPWHRVALHEETS